ncbi:translation initiation factor IF-2-like [Leopardus geoffroyi]|uniref:translation initiation factor IF-2-like n=1 Tax=Leopardus geoffroyi TaxID=46844 RepID=UPI001E2644C4|nr:translation initiation factor IF-2-like [Leopardus geoffroyi]
MRFKYVCHYQNPRSVRRQLGASSHPNPVLLEVRDWSRAHLHRSAHVNAAPTLGATSPRAERPGLGKDRSAARGTWKRKQKGNERHRLHGGRPPHTRPSGEGRAQLRRPAPGSRWLRGPASQLQPNFPARSGPGDAPGIFARSRRLAEQPGRAWPPPASPAARAPGEVRPGRSAHAHTRSPGARARLPPPSPPAGQSRSAVIGLPDCRRTPTQIGRPGQYRLRRREAGVARERVETTPVTGFPAARSGSGVGWRKERGRGAEGGSGGRLRASLRADRLGRRPARSGVGAAASAARPLGPDSRRASGRRAAAAARGQARGSPPRDISEAGEGTRCELLLFGRKRSPLPFPRR